LQEPAYEFGPLTKGGGGGLGLSPEVRPGWTTGRARHGSSIGGVLPRVDMAIVIAQALGTTVEAIFPPAENRAVHT